MQGKGLWVRKTSVGGSASEERYNRSRFILEYFSRGNIHSQSATGGYNCWIYWISPGEETST